jgi:hypothetical protein
MATGRISSPGRVKIFPFPMSSTQDLGLFVLTNLFFILFYFILSDFRLFYRAFNGFYILDFSICYCILNMWLYHFMFTYLHFVLTDPLDYKNFYHFYTCGTPEDCYMAETCSVVVYIIKTRQVASRGGNYNFCYNTCATGCTNPRLRLLVIGKYIVCYICMTFPMSVVWQDGKNKEWNEMKPMWKGEGRGVYQGDKTTRTRS